MKYTVEAIKVGQSLVPGPEVYWMSHWKTMEQLYFYVILIRGDNKVVLINTGAPKDLTVLNERWRQFIGSEGIMRRQPEEEIEVALRNRGVKLRDVDYVLLTPLQMYATANIPLFTNAIICLSKRGWREDYHDPIFPLHVEPELRIPSNVMEYLKNNEDKLRLIDDEEEIIPGISARWVGTHHRSSMAYCIDTVKGKVVVSDCFFKYENLEKLQPLGIQESMQECFTAYKWIAKTADIAIPLYDPEVLKRHPDGKVC